MPIRGASEVQLQRVNDNRIVALVRTSGYGQVCYSDYPYIDWEIRDANVVLAGQSFVISKNDVIVCVNRNTDYNRTNILYSTLDGNFSNLYFFLSGGDTGYADILVEPEKE